MQIEADTHQSVSGGQVRVVTAFPTGVRTMDRFERDSQRLLRTAHTSWAAVMAIFGQAEDLGSEREFLAGLEANPS